MTSNHFRLLYSGGDGIAVVPNATVRMIKMLFNKVEESLQELEMILQDKDALVSQGYVAKHNEELVRGCRDVVVLARRV